MKQPRLESILNRMRDKQADLYLVSKPENIFWLSGFSGSNGMLLVGENTRLLLTDFRYLTQASIEADGFEIQEVERGMLEGVCRLIRQLAPTRILAESTHLTQARWAILSHGLGSIPLTGDPEGLETLRMIKDMDEIAVIEEGIIRTAAVYEELAGWIRPGMSERQIAAELVYRLRLQGGSGEAFSPIIAAGENSACPHHQPTDRVWGPGEPLKLDFGMKRDGYCADFTRMLFAGQPDAEMAGIHHVVREAQEKAISVVSPGILASDVDQAAREVIAAAGYGDYFGHGLGHGLGIEIHEKPSVAPGSLLRLEPGMVFTVEPGIYLPGRGGVRIEDVVVVTEDGCRNLTRAGKEIRCIENLEDQS